MKRRAMFMLATMVAALLLASGVALAATIACSSSAICWGTVGNDVMIGDSGNDDMRALDGNDSLSGGFGGNDSLRGEAGDDTLSGGNGNDIYRFGNAWGQDSILSETAGSDTLRFDDVGWPLSIDLRPMSTLAMELLPDLAGPYTYNKVSTPTDDVVIENAFGGSHSDDIKGNDGPNTLVGNAGNDFITGYRGADRIYGSDAALFFACRVTFGVVRPS